MINGFSKGEKIIIFIGLILVCVVLVILEGWVVTILWNEIMPEIFGLTKITVKQGVGMLALCYMLFKSNIYNSSKKR